MAPNFTIACGADTYTVDLDVIARYSEYFRRAPKFGKEASKGIITLHDDDPAMISLMIEFLHQGDYNASCWKMGAHAKALTWTRSHGSSPYARSEMIDEYKLHSGASAVSSAPSAQSLLEFHATSSTMSKKRKRHTPQTTQLDEMMQKRQRVVDGMAKGSGRALYHTPTPRHIILHVQLWKVADKYLVTDLQAHCTKRFKEAAEYYHAHPEMVEAILWVYEDVPEHAKDLREAILAVVGEHPELLEDEEVKRSVSCRELRDAVALWGSGRTEWVRNHQRDVWPHVS